MDTSQTVVFENHLERLPRTLPVLDCFPSLASSATQLHNTKCKGKHDSRLPLHAVATAILSLKKPRYKVDIPPSMW